MTALGVPLAISWIYLLAHVWGAGVWDPGALLGQPFDPSVTTSFEIVPGERFGPIRASTSGAELEALVRAGSLQRGEVYLGEGFCTDGARLFAGTPDEVEIAWQDVGRTRVAFVRTRGLGGRWRSRRGVAVGTPLRDLERLAGRVLEFSGFDWDYGGGLSWEEAGGGLGLRLSYTTDPKIAALPRFNEVIGDHPVRSDHPIVRAMDVRVAELVLVWGVPSDHDCR